MEIKVRMTVEEFQEFLKYKEDRALFQKERERLRKAPFSIACSLKYGLEEMKSGRFKIIDHEHVGDAWDTAKEFMPAEE